MVPSVNLSHASPFRAQAKALGAYREIEAGRYSSKFIGGEMPETHAGAKSGTGILEPGSVTKFL